MGFLLMLSRKIQLEDRKNNLEYQNLNLTRKLNDLTNYASILSQDSVNLSDIASLPSSIFSQGMSELTNAHFQAMNISQAQFQQAAASGMFGQNMDPYVAGIAQQKMYENARKEIQKQLQARLNEEEKSLQAQQTRIQAQIELTDKELEKVEQREAKDIESAVGGYGLRG